MIDFVIDLCTEIAGFFLDLWVNKIVGRFKKKKGKDSDKVDG